VTDFGTADWSASTMMWCDAHGLGGGLYAYMGTGSTSTAAVDTTAHNLKFNFMVTAGQYAGGGISFDSCVNASGFTAVQFTASVTAGSLSGCVLLVQVQTQDERPSTATNPGGGTCASSCNMFPAYQLPTAPTATAATYTVMFTQLSNPGSSTIPTRTQIVGLQWQANSGQGTGACTAELRIDDVKFIP
jgi:hypothetical protein